MSVNIAHFLLLLLLTEKKKGYPCEPGDQGNQKRDEVQYHFLWGIGVFVVCPWAPLPMRLY